MISAKDPPWIAKSSSYDPLCGCNPFRVVIIPLWITAETFIPSNWAGFLRVDGNKTQLFSFLAQSVLTITTDKLIVKTQGPIVLSNHPMDQTDLAPCSHEEADTRLMVHLADGAKAHKRFLIRTVDTDVVVLAVSLASRHHDIEIWVAMGTGKNFRYITVHDVARAMGAEKAGCLPMFHAFTGCDTVSAFTGIGKKTAWEIWCAFPQVTNTFQRLLCPPFDLSDSDRSLLERFVTLLYDKTSNCQDVNTARQHLFTKTGRQIENIPPSSEALYQHCLRAIYQGGHIRGQTEIPAPVLPNPCQWGWQFVNGRWLPFWTVLSEASVTCRELLRCGCKKPCKTKRCRCFKSDLSCTALCTCTCLENCAHATNTSSA